MLGAWAALLKPVTKDVLESGNKKRSAAFDSPSVKPLSKCERDHLKEEKKAETIQKAKQREQSKAEKAAEKETKKEEREAKKAAKEVRDLHPRAIHRPRCRAMPACVCSSPCSPWTTTGRGALAEEADVGVHALRGRGAEAHLRGAAGAQGARASPCVRAA